MPRLSLEIDPDLRAEFDLMAREYGTNFAGLLGRGIKAIAIARQQRQRGFRHFGFTDDVKKLDVELRGLLPEEPHVVAVN